MTHRLAYTSLLVPDYDEAIRFFTQGLSWRVREDTPMAAGKRWVVVAPDDEPGSGALLLARATTPGQQAMIGRQGAGRVWLFVHTTRFDADLERLPRHGARLTESRSEPYGRVLVFEDPWGNRWDLIEPAAMLAP